MSEAVTDIESAGAPVKKLNVAVTADAESEAAPTVCVAVVAEIVNESELIVALDGVMERTPSPNAATATSAIRLKVVFVDILFLSVVVMKTFSMAALR